MQILTDPNALASQCRLWHKEGNTISLVPTMGYYHAGHENLMHEGRKLGDKMVVSLFVNPAQFGPGEDLAAYPRDLERDSAIAEKCGADILFAPEAGALYRPDHATWVEVQDLAKGLCGKSRPVHFRGVCTIVLKLFMLTGADVAVFGRKDWQQQAIIARMVRDLNIPIEIVALPTTREADGLAMSSRNVYLTLEERAAAPAIRKGLLHAAKLVANGEKNGENLRRQILDYWSREFPEGRLDYLSLVDPVSLEPLETIDGPALLACAMHLGAARLIDNILLNPA